MDLFKDLKDIIINKFDEQGITVNDGEVHELLGKYLNIQHKLVDTKLRKVHYSTELKSKMAGQPYYDVLKIVEEKFEKGEDITPHFRKHVIDPESQDGLLNDWGIKHLHLSNTKKTSQDKFYVSSDYLLMFIHGLDFVCFIDVRLHSESRLNNDPEYPLWVRDELLEIIQKNWPKLLEPYELKGFSDINPVYTKEEHKELRNAGALLFVKIGDKVYYPPGGGVTSGRTGGFQTSKAIEILRRISRMKRIIENKTEEIKEMMEKDGISPPSELDFTLIDDPDHGLVCLENQTNWKYPLNIKLDLQ